MAKSKSPQIKKKHTKSWKPSLGGIYWLVFVMAVVAWGGIFGLKFSEFSEFAEKLEDKMAEDREVSWSISGEGVLGVGDSTTGDDESDADVETEEVLAEVDSEADSDEDEENDTEAEEVDNLVDEIEEERREKLRSALHLQLPDETDNPNYPVTFTEPTEEGVQIQVDGDGFAKKKSPFLLPALAIGKHTLNFKFDDEDEVSQNLEEIVIIIPRAPKMAEDQKLEFRSDEKIEFHGTALPHSKVVFLVSSDVVTTVVNVNSEGEWSVVIKEELAKGSHSIVSFVRKDGYASNFSEPVKFSIGAVAGEVSTNGIGEFNRGMTLGGVSFDFESLFDGENLYYTLAGFSAVSFILIMLSSFLGRRAGKKKVESVVIGNGLNNKKVSLREKFGGVGVVAKGIGKKIAKKSDVSGKTGDLSEEKSHTKTGKKSKKKPEKKLDMKTPKKSAKSSENKSKEKTQEVKNKRSGKSKKTDETKSAVSEAVSNPEKGKVYSKEDFLKTFSSSVDNSAENSVENSKDSNKISITLTSKKDEEK